MERMLVHQACERFDNLIHESVGEGKKRQIIVSIVCPEVDNYTELDGGKESTNEEKESIKNTQGTEVEGTINIEPTTVYLLEFLFNNFLYNKLYF